MSQLKDRILKDRIEQIYADLPKSYVTLSRDEGDFQEKLILMQMLSDIIRTATRLFREYGDHSYNSKKSFCQTLLLQAYNNLYAMNPQGTISYLQENYLIRDEINEAFNIVPNAMALVTVPASNAFREAFRKILRPGGPFPPLPVPFIVGRSGPGATDDSLRQKIIDMFGAEGENILPRLTSANMGAYAPEMYARYQARYAATDPVPVTVIEFGNNILDYLLHKGGGKKQRRSIIKKRKSLSKKRKNRRKSNKRQL